MANRSPVDIYFNLHKNKYSIKCRRTGKVIMHSDRVYCGKPEFIVQPAGREKVLKDKKKNVHAFVRTSNWTLSTTPKWIPEMNWIRVFYNPYKAAFFHYEDGSKVISNHLQCKMIIEDNKPYIFCLG